MTKKKGTTGGEGQTGQRGDQLPDKKPSKPRKVKKRTVTLYEERDLYVNLNPDALPVKALVSLGTFASAVKAKQAITKEHEGKTLVIGQMYDSIKVEVEEIPAKYKVKIS